MPLVQHAPAKINLFLHVTGRRADGYHTLQSLAVFAGQGDRLEAAAAPELTLEVTGTLAAGVPTGNGNLVLRAAQGLQRLAGVSQGARLTLHKYLPHGAGLGGGSSDAAAALRLLMRLWQISPPRDELAALALSLGADVPVCLEAPRPALMEGVGEQLSAVPALPSLPLLLVNPGKPLATASVFAAREGAYGRDVALPAGEFGAVEACAAWLRQHTHNDLEPPALRLMPEIGDVLALLRGQEGCLLARMSGSGATCFGIFATESAMATAAKRLRTAQPEWWVHEALTRCDFPTYIHST